MKIFQLFAAATLIGLSSAKQAIRGATAFERMLHEDLGTQCQDNPVCAVMGLTGTCCPTTDGIYLDCCNRECSAHTKCVNLTGNCCPTIDDVELDCCNHQPAIDPGHQYRNAGGGSGNQTASPLCSAYTKCSGLAGNCCPTVDDVMLDCCYGL